MLVRRVLEWSIFVIYWFGFGSFAYGIIYGKYLVQDLNITEKFGRWSPLAVFTVILVVIYLIVRYLAKLLYAKCKVAEKRLMHNMKQEVHDLKRQSGNSNLNTNLAFENEKQIRKSKKNKNYLKRGKSLDDLSQAAVGKPMKNARSYDTILHSQRYRVHKAGNSDSIQFYEVPYWRNGTPPPAYHTLSRDLYNSDDEYEIYSKVPANEKRKGKKSSSLGNVLDDDIRSDMQSIRSLGNIHQQKYDCYSDYSEIDGIQSATRVLRRAPPPPVGAARRSKSLNRIPNKTKSFENPNELYLNRSSSGGLLNKSKSLQRSQSPLHQCMIEVHQPNYYTQPRSHSSRNPRPDMVKKVLVTNTFGPRKL